MRELKRLEALLERNSCATAFGCMSSATDRTVWTPVPKPPVIRQFESEKLRFPDVRRFQDSQGPRSGVGSDEASPNSKSSTNAFGRTGPTFRSFRVLARELGKTVREVIQVVCPSAQGIPRCPDAESPLRSKVRPRGSRIEFRMTASRGRQLGLGRDFGLNTGFRSSTGHVQFPRAWKMFRLSLRMSQNPISHV